MADISFLLPDPLGKGQIRAHQIIAPAVPVAKRTDHAGIRPPVHRGDLVRQIHEHIAGQQGRPDLLIGFAFLAVTLCDALGENRRSHAVFGDSVRNALFLARFTEQTEHMAVILHLLPLLSKGGVPPSEGDRRRVHGLCGNPSVAFPS